MNILCALESAIFSSVQSKPAFSKFIMTAEASSIVYKTIKP
uniref:Uncharacterized protein n=1 Tax=Myoviridae sp. ctsK93 TaxID=2825190 RepID=A0A8S5PKL5_9CAUD|nr:MAG TPA: hypothetical protein [Myoviridae sp. ctsK93]